MSVNVIAKIEMCACARPNYIKVLRTDMKAAENKKGQYMLLKTFRGDFWSSVSFPRKRAFSTSLASVHIPLQKFAFQTFN